MEQSRIDRINELARKAKTPGGLTDAEKAEQQKLRDEYRMAFRRSLCSQLDSTYVVDEKGNKRKLGKK